MVFFEVIHIGLERLESVANADGDIGDFDVFCVTVEATQDTLLEVVGG